MALVDQAAMRHVNADPAALRHIQTHIDPGIAGQIRLVGDVKVAAHIARWKPQTAADGDHDMRLILVHTDTGFKDLQCRGGARPEKG